MQLGKSFQWNTVRRPLYKRKLRAANLRRRDRDCGKRRPVEQGREDPGGEGTPISRVGVGIGIRKGAPRPDISTPEAIKRAMLGAKAIAYGAVGASTPYITRMFDTLGIADTMKAKTLLFDTSDGTNGAVADGKADFGITLVSEILPVKSLELLGPFPDAFQGYVRFSAAVSANAKNPEAASKLIKFLAGPDALASIKARGMQAH